MFNLLTELAVFRQALAYVVARAGEKSLKEDLDFVDLVHRERRQPRLVRDALGRWVEQVFPLLAQARLEKGCLPVRQRGCGIWRRRPQEPVDEFLGLGLK